MITWTLQRLALSSLTDWYKNPRQLSRSEYEQLQTSLDKFGLIDKPIVNADGVNTVIGGHQRLRVLRDMGVEEVECWVPSRQLSTREIEECNIRLNKATGSWDWDILANEFEVVDLLDWGFSEFDLQLHEMGAEEGEGDTGGGNGAGDIPEQQWLVLVECESEVQQGEVMELLSYRGYQCRAGASGHRGR